MARWTELPAGCKRSAVDGERPGWRWTEGVFECWDTWLVPRELRTEFLRIVGGTVENIGGILKRVVPLRNKDFDYAIAEEVNGSVDRGGWDRARNDFDYERVRIVYRTPKYGDTFTSIGFAPDERRVNKPVTSASGLADEPSNGLVYNLTFHKLASVPLDTWSAVSGKINNATWRTFPTGTVLFTGPAGEQEAKMTGEITYPSVTLVYRVNRLRWDYDYDATGAWVSVGVPPTADFTAAFGA
jgi:hypothetical protein